MEKTDFEGSRILEKLAEIGKIDEFLVAIDSDDFDEAKALMKNAGIDLKMIEIVLDKMKTTEYE